MAEDRRADRPRHEPNKERRERQHRRDERVRAGEELLRKHRGRGDAVQEEVVPLDRGANGRGNDRAKAMTSEGRVLRMAEGGGVSHARHCIRPRKGTGYSWVTKSLSDQDITVASARSPAIAISPAENDPVASRNHPMAYGPTKPPSVATLLMKARPPAAARPVRKRVGIVQKIARADVMPASATVIHNSDSQKLAVAIASPRPAAAMRQASARFLILRP